VGVVTLLIGLLAGSCAEPQVPAGSGQTSTSASTTLGGLSSTVTEAPATSSTLAASSTSSSATTAPEGTVSAVEGRALVNGQIEVLFVLSVEGDYRFEEPGRGRLVTYDARELRRESQLTRLRRDGIPPAGPDADHVLGYCDPGLMATALERVASGTVSATEVLDRPAISWQSDGVSDSGAYQLTVVVDDATLLPLSEVYEWPASASYPEGQTLSWEVSEFEAAQVPRSLFFQGFEPGHLAGSDQTFRSVSLGEAAAGAGY
jgi:hypothetical protein